MMVAGLAAYAAAKPEILPAYNAGTTFHKNSATIDSAIVQTVGVYIAVVAMACCHRKDIKFSPPSRNATVYENLLLMLGQVDADEKPDELFLNTYRHSGAMGADHEITNSTTALLVAASSLGDPVSSLISAISTCYGPLHMGACESAYKSMEKIGSVENARLLIERVKRGERRLYGYGHRMYRTVDPRISLTKGLLRDLKIESHPVLAIAMEVDRLASTDEYFVKRDLHANVDLFVVFVGIALWVSMSFVFPSLRQVLIIRVGAGQQTLFHSLLFCYDYLVIWHIGVKLWVSQVNENSIIYYQIETDRGVHFTMQAVKLS